MDEENYYIKIILGPNKNEDRVFFEPIRVDDLYFLGDLINDFPEDYCSVKGKTHYFIIGINGNDNLPEELREKVISTLIEKSYSIFKFIFMKNKTYKNCLYYVKNDHSSFKFVPDNLKSYKLCLLSSHYFSKEQEKFPKKYINLNFLKNVLKITYSSGSATFYILYLNHSKKSLSYYHF
jgi:hypothetical protein